MMRNSFISLSLFLHISVCAQHHDWSAPIGSPSAAGFYAIPLPPRVIALSKEELADLRLMDDKGKEVPYLAKKDQLAFDREFFRPYEKVKKEIVKGCCTNVTVENPSHKELRSLCLLIKNHDLYKTAVLRGSDDGQNWYAMMENISFSPIQNNRETFGASFVSFPLNNYGFMQLQINDSSSAPLNILEVGEYTSETELGKWDTIPTPQISQVDSTSSKMTFVKLVFDAPYTIEKMELSFAGPKFFSRNATLYTIQKDDQKKEWKQFVQGFQISSKSASSVLLHDVRAREYLIAIENEDNPPIRLKWIVSSQLHSYLLAYLEKNIPYSLKFGQEEATPPQYDLSAFADSVPSSLPELTIGAITHHEKVQTAVVKEPFFQTKWWIWAAIGIVLVLLIWMSAKMLKEMGGGSN